MTATYVDDRADVLGRVDLAALFVDLGHPQGRNRQWPCPSPMHAQTGATPPVSIGRGPDGYDLWRCHGCGIGGSAVDLLTITRGLDVADAFRAVRRLAGVPELVASPRPPAPPRSAVAAVDPDAARLDGTDAEEVMGTYLASRRWSPELAEAHGLHVVRGQRGYPRVRHPYRVRGAVQWWQDRATHPDDAGPKWASPAGLRRCLYARDLADALDPARGVLWITEGPADAIALGHLLSDAAIVGVPGTTGLERWAPMLAGRDVLILTDPDDAGDRAAAELAQLTAERGGRADRLRPPVDVDDWRRQHPDDDAWSAAITAELDRQCPAVGSGVTP